MKYLSLFSGIGGFELGLGDEHECCGFAEIDKHAVQVYRTHFPSHTNFGDITKVDERGLPDIDLICAGFPCQAFSIAGKKQGFDDARGTLFFEIARIARQKQPRLLLLENVRGLLSNGQGRTFLAVLGVLDALGYDCQWQVLNSKDFGVPQNRERLFIVGHLRGTPRPAVFPLLQTAPETHRCQQSEVRVHSTQTRHLTRSRLKFSAGGSGQHYRDDGIAYCLMTGVYQAIEVLRPRYQLRNLTPLECERLQGYPDGWTEGIPDTQRYRTLGNAVTVNVVRAIAKRLN